MRSRSDVTSKKTKKPSSEFLQRKKVRDTVFIVLMLLIPFAHFAVFYLGVNFSSLSLAFRDQYTEEFTFANFERFFTSWKLDWEMDVGWKYAFFNTLIQMVISNFVNMPLVVFVTFALYKKFYGHNFFRVVFYLPAIVGEVIMLTMQAYVLDATGPIIEMGKFVGIQWDFNILQSGLLGYDGSARTTFFVTRITISGSTILLLTGALNRIPKDLFDYAKLDGVGFFREFYYIALPLTWSTVGIMWIMGFATGWNVYNDVMLLTGGNHNTQNLGFALMSTTLGAVTGDNGDANFNYPAAIGMLMTVIVAPLTLFLRWLSEKFVEPVDF